jgi:hypothetical protein
MIRPEAFAVTIGAAAALLLAGFALLAPVEARHSAPFGFSLTLDPERGIAVRGGFVTANYPNFNRLDLDLRAYQPQATYDLTIHVRPDRAGAADVRTIHLSLRGERIRHDKAPFADPFLTVRFPPIAESAGRRYYVWVDPGPRNRDNVVTLWSLKSYSRVTGRAVLGALLDNPPGDAPLGLARTVLSAMLLGLVAAFGWLMAATVTLARSELRAIGAGVHESTVAPPGERWYNLGRLARRHSRRSFPSGTHRPRG